MRKSGVGTFDAKRTNYGSAGANCRDVTIFGLGNVGTCINLTSPLTGTNLVVANFRTHFYYGGNPSDAILQLIGQVDDGAVLYLNGTELQRVRMPAGTLLRTTFATGGPADTDPSATFQFVAPAALLNGNNLLAVDVRQNNLTSSDITMGLQVKAVTTVPLVQPPVLTIVLNANGSVTVSWNGAGTLICTNDPTTPRASWTVLGTTNPRTFAAGTLVAYQFYAVRLP